MICRLPFCRAVPYFVRTGFRAILILASVLLAPAMAMAQVNVTATAGTANATYTTLGDAFSAINAGTHRGSISISLTGNTTELATAVLGASGSGGASYASVVISPSGSATRTINGSMPAPLIDLDGADNVTINGLNSGGDALTLTNADTSATASTLRLINDASNNVISNVSILGAGSGVTQGTVLFATGTATGNDNNVVSNCTIAQAGAATPTNGVYASGSAAPADNSGNAINNCSIANFFNAASPTAGILIASGDTQWTLSGNRLFQAATRTYTVANTHRGIQVASGANHSITGNVIGFASAAGTGVYTMAGAIATRFIAIDIGLTAAAPVSVQGNTVSGISLATSSGATTTNGVLCGLNITGGNASVGTTAPNVIGGAAGTDLLSVVSTNTGALVVGMHTSSADTVTVQNNIIGGLSSSGVTASAAGSVTAINVSESPASLTISGNTIGNATANNLRGGTSGLTTGNSLVSGIHLGIAGSGIIAIANNTLQNLSSFGTGTTGFVRGIGTDGSTSVAATLNISGNTISNLVSDNANNGVANGQAGAGGINIGLGANSQIRDNVISNIARTNVGAIGGWSAGIVHGIAVNTTITRNRIFGLSNASTSASATTPGIVAGIVIRSGTSVITVTNNMIALGSGQATNTTFIGIQGNHGSTPDPVDKIYFNTINIIGTAAAGAQPSFGFLRGDLSATVRNQTVDLRNNLITNTRSGGTGAHFAIANNFGATAGPIGWAANASDFNVLNANAATVGYWNGNLTFPGWKATSASDGNSVSGFDVAYVNAANDLHLNLSWASPMESCGTLIAGTMVDYDQQPRPGPAGSVNDGAFAPDIGADEFDGIHYDALSPTINYTPLPTATLPGNRTVVATIADAGGVAVGIDAPRIYYRKNAGAYFSQACTQGPNGTWTCDINHAGLGGVVFNDVVQYFVVAQDRARNGGANPSAGFYGLVNSVFSPPSVPNQYLIGAAFSGDYNVGPGEAFASLTNDGGLFDAINYGALTGNTTIHITADLLLETGTVALNQWPEDGVGGYTLTIKPSGGARTIVGSANAPLIRFNGADRVTLDGSTTGAIASGQIGGDAALRELTIQNTNTGASAVVIHFGSGSNGAQNNVLRNLNLSGQDPTTSLAVVSLSGNTPSTAGTDNDNNRVENCAFKRATFGVFSLGQNAGNPNIGTVLTMNDLSAGGADRIRRVGMLVLNDNGAVVSLNSVGGIDSNESQDAVGIGLGVQSLDGNLVTGGGVTNATVTHNRVSGVSQTSTFSAAGIAVGGSPGGTNTVANNLISGVNANATSPHISVGLFVAGSAGSSTRVLYNSVALSGDRGAQVNQLPSYGLAISGSDPNVELKNNAFATTQIATGGGANAKSYAIGMASSTFANLDSNFNNFFASGANAGFFRAGSLLAGAGTDYANISAWRTAVADDTNSIEQDPSYVSDSDPHLQVTSPLLGNATPIAGITVDVDNQLRSAIRPCIGADEIIDADVQIDKSNGVAGLLAGQSTVYAVVVANAGPVAASGASVTDTLPATLIDGTWACVQAQSTAACPIPETGLGNLASSVNLNPGQYLRFDVMATVDGTAGAFVTNTASVAVANGQNDPSPANNSATDADPIVTIGLFADGFEGITRSNLTVPGASAELGR